MSYNIIVSLLFFLWYFVKSSETTFSQVGKSSLRKDPSFTTVSCRKWGRLLDGLLTHTEVTEFGWDVSLGEVLSTEEAEPGCWSLQLIIL